MYAGSVRNFRHVLKNIHVIKFRQMLNGNFFGGANRSKVLETDSNSKIARNGRDQGCFSGEFCGSFSAMPFKVPLGGKF